MDKNTRTAKESKRAELTEITTVCLIHDKETNSIVVENRVKNDWLGYAIPGGHIEPDEWSLSDSVIREMKEETGLSISNPRLKGIKQFKTGFGRYMVFIYYCSDYTGKLVSSDEGKVSWVKLDNLKNLNTVPNLEEVINIAMSNDRYAHEMHFVIKNEDDYDIIIS